MNFGENTKEFSPKQGKDIPVWQSPKYIEAKKKATEIITDGKFGITEADFWILMNETKTGKMAYTSLILSHNGCLKINSCLDNPFDPECVFVDKEGYNNSLVYSYCNKSQGIYEVGEVAKDNCKNAYPYAMAFKRLFDRVVLKLSKLAFSGIMSEAESDDFKQPDMSERKVETPSEIHIKCLLELAREKGVTESTLCSKYNLKKISDMSMADYTTCVNGLKKMESINGN
jgi:hypothetical protein